MNQDRTAGTLRRLPVQKRSAERFERLLDACAELLDEVGYAGLTTKEVARRAEVPIGTLYQFFSDREGLIGALAARNLESFLGRVADRLEQEEPEGISGIVDVTVDEFVTMRRTITGFGVVDFGAVGQDHILEPTLDNNTAVAGRLRSLTASLIGVQDDAEFEIAVRVALECADSVLQLAFRIDPLGDAQLIAECKRVLNSYLNDRRR
ncbi:TetR family transcriptional regulator [Streptomyces sp. R-74717]|uniref:TetR/AcrR family transcriptional regulator n=1 Tax=Streptomyces TaxID=1883 RepID=UPI0022520E69|nr:MULTISPECIES: TetR/AcrR family transcriptional regulator [unclassified Streptomyces]WSP59745.1 TetR family transcriptional regulator [Streptomyces sp. NBC_01241]WSU19739.1 TetR family transcriptional regulator [Streptomyces sp. NBC_01108]WTE31992.1 TetR family transcriptional regulator [Streptomyces sp. NBC_01618]MCX4791555.1 TetR family transcriptional regulator [Streptomyces sp. NBC_01221]MCX4792744.1 TetR family transcriptional regulator [Streptomyces sp. NBC_01242]